MRPDIFTTAIAVLFSALLLSPTIAQADTPLAETREIAKEAYTYANPVVDSYRILYSSFVDRKP